MINFGIDFDEKSGSVKSIKHGGFEYVYGAIPVLTLALRNKAGKQIKLSVDELKNISFEESENYFKAVYENDLVKATIGAEIDDEIRWFLEMETEENHVLEWANYPCITVPNTLSSAGEGHKILWGWNEGVLAENLEDREKTYSYIEPEYSTKGVTGLYPGAVETQFMAYYNNDDGLYFGAHDKDDCLKGIDFYRHENGGIFLQFRHFCGVDFGEKYVMGYPMIMRFFKGDWHDAADIYKNWFEENHSWIPICEDESLPEWYHKSPVVVTYPVRGTHDRDEMVPNRLFPYVNVLPHIERLEKEFDSPVMVLIMHWEGTAPWAPPIVWPPYGGEEALRELIDKLHERGDVFGVYCSGIGWTIKSNLNDYNTQKYFDDNNLKTEMCASPEGTLASEICKAQREGFDLCPAREFAVKTVKEQVDLMINAGIDYIQLLDQNHGGTSYFCYSREHGHPPVPGKWQVDAMKRFMEAVSKDAGNVLFGCESAAAESYIPNLKFSDNRFNLNYLVGRQVPVYSYIYHKYVNNFMGNQVYANGQCNHEKSPYNNLERTAYAFTAGDMLTVVINQDGEITWNWIAKPADGMPKQQPIKTLVRNLNAWRMKDGKKYLHTGDMKKPFKVICDNNILERHWVESVATRPKIHTSAWEAPDGSFGQFLVNYNEEEVVCEVCLPDEEFTLTFQNGEKLCVCGKTELKIAPLSAVLVEKK